MYKVDRPFFYLVTSLVVFGMFIFSSAALGLVAREGYSFGYILLKQLITVVLLGGFVAYLTSRISYRFWSKYSFYIFLLSVLLTFLVWIPGFGFEHGGARRWISLGLLNFQPAEFLKLGAVVYTAAWVASVKSKIKTWKYGFLAFLVIMGLVGAALLSQPDTGTTLIIFTAVFGIFIAGGLPWKQIFTIVLGGLAAFVGLVLVRPYLLDRILTFFNPASDPLGSGFQIQQSLIAIGSGGIFGRGLGQSVQKFQYLPEPMGDSIFAVFAEEWGIIGSIVLISLFTAIILRGFQIASRAPSVFSGLLVTGIILLIGVQSLFNIASMLNVVPLTGMPLLFVSQGGTAMFFALAEVGIVLQVSRSMR